MIDLLLTLGSAGTNMKKLKPGMKFEKIVTEIQKQLDSNSSVSHDEILVDRLGQKRQFDVVIRGKFAGQEILGVIECKDLNKKVGTPEVDAFNTKSQDVNANFKILVSKKGFSKPALKKSNHYGIQTLSLLKSSDEDAGVIIGTKWYADIYYWSQCAVTLQFVEEPCEKVLFRAEELTIEGKRVVDGFYNYLAEEYPMVDKTGWVVNVRAEFKKPQKVFINGTESYLCRALDFSAYRDVDFREKEVGWTGTGFYDWQKSQATVPPNTTMKSNPVPTDFFNWNKRENSEIDKTGFIYGRFIVHSLQFEKVEDAIDLDSL